MFYGFEGILYFISFNSMFSKCHRFFLLLIFLTCSSYGFAQQYESAVYMSRNLIEEKDFSVYDTVEFVGWTINEVYDRRVPDYVEADVAIYKVTWKDGSEMEIQILKEVFEDKSKDSVLNELVIPFAHKLGQLPFFLLNGLNRLVIFKGEERWSASFGSIYIHLDYEKINSGYVEEILLHEAGHASIDIYLRDNSVWKAAQRKDRLSLSKYGEDNLHSEDLTESIIFWLAVKYRSRRILLRDSIKIRKSMPYRLEFLDSLNFNVYPLDQASEFDHLYEVSRHPEWDYDLENAMTFDELTYRLGWIFFGIIAFLIIRKLFWPSNR
jgi:hypothetical protein